jgi:hypothetical protein
LYGLFANFSEEAGVVLRPLIPVFNKLMIKVVH